MLHLQVSRSSVWDFPPLLERLLTSPLAVLISFIHMLLLAVRGPSFLPPKSKPTIRVVCISDSHSHKPAVPPGDLLIHAGDLTNSGTKADVQSALDWLNSLPHKYKVVIAGNHDNYLDPKSEMRQNEDRQTKAKLNWGGITYLHHSSTILRFKGGRSLEIYGAPGIPEIGKGHAFQYTPDSSPFTNRVPMTTDILVTHTPPATHLDIGLGCPSLLREIWRVKPRLHVFGHVHSGHGREAVYWDRGQAAFERIVTRKGGILVDLIPSHAWADALRVVWYGVKGIFWQYLMVGPRGANGGVLINAALTYRSTSNIGNPAQIVEL